MESMGVASGPGGFYESGYQDVGVVRIYSSFCSYIPTSLFNF